MRDQGVVTKLGSFAAKRLGMQALPKRALYYSIRRPAPLLEVPVSSVSPGTNLGLYDDIGVSCKRHHVCSERRSWSRRPEQTIHNGDATNLGKESPCTASSVRRSVVVVTNRETSIMDRAFDANGRPPMRCRIPGNQRPSHSLGWLSDRRGRPELTFPPPLPPSARFLLQLCTPLGPDPPTLTHPSSSPPLSSA
ncbi:hypothetical protein K458DRAFT_421366, partial [Lentithecium fluviatile CBS 122367]